MQFPKPIVEIIIGYSAEWQFIDSINENEIPINAWDRLSLNPRAVDYIDKHPEKIHPRLIMANPAAGHIIWSDRFTKRFKKSEQRPYEGRIGRSLKAINAFGKTYWLDIQMLSRNSSQCAIEALKTLPIDQLNWDSLSCNTHPWAIMMLETHPEHIKQDVLNRNPAALRLINYTVYDSSISSNPNPVICDFLRKNMHMIHPKGLLRNPRLIDIWFDKDLRSEYFNARPNWRQEIGCMLYMARNPNPIAIKDASKSSIYWYEFITNPGIFKPVEPIGLREIFIQYRRL